MWSTKIHLSFNLSSNLLLFSPNQCPLGFYYMTGRPAALDVSSQRHSSSYKDLSWAYLLCDEQRQTFPSAFTGISSDPLIIPICFYTVIYTVENVLIFPMTCLMKPIDLYIGPQIISCSQTHLGLCFVLGFVFYFEKSMEHLSQSMHRSQIKTVIQTYKRYKFSLRDGGKTMMHLLRLNILLQLPTSVSTFRNLLLSLGEN